VLIFLVVDMHVAVGEHATAQENWQTKADGLWTASSLGMCSGISWAKQNPKYTWLISCKPHCRSNSPNIVMWAMQFLLMSPWCHDMGNIAPSRLS
jgi:hypothetical protein